MLYESKGRLPDFGVSPATSPAPIFRDMTSAFHHVRKAAEQSIASRPLIALVIAFATGGMIGWLVKRR